ncbi:isoleucyl-tRNA synthetase domain protein, partial [Orientia tsutsugamushi str. UT144]
LEISSTGTEINNAIDKCKSIITQQTLSSICTIDVYDYVYSDKIGNDTVTIKIAKAVRH